MYDSSKMNKYSLAFFKMSFQVFYFLTILNKPIMIESFLEATHKRAYNFVWTRLHFKLIFKFKVDLKSIYKNKR